MERHEILKRVNDIFIAVLDDDSILLNDTSTANDVEGWDSLNHIQIIVAIEKFFKIRFSSLEIQGFKNVGDLCTSIQSRLETTA